LLHPVSASRHANVQPTEIDTNGVSAIAFAAKIRAVAFHA
jgi:endoglucanase Acf2